jgi:hypothetical protein
VSDEAPQEKASWGSTVTCKNGYQVRCKLMARWQMHPGSAWRSWHRYTVCRFLFQLLCQPKQDFVSYSRSVCHWKALQSLGWCHAVASVYSRDEGSAHKESSLLERRNYSRDRLGLDNCVLVPMLRATARLHFFWICQLLRIHP